MRKRPLCRILLFAALLLSSAAVAQQAAPSLSVTGAVKQPLTLTAADLAAMPRAKAVTDNNGIQTMYEGVWLSDVLKKAGVPLGPGLRGAALAGYVLASASDGYQVVFSIGELDPDMTDGQFLLADTANGKAAFWREWIVPARRSQGQAGRAIRPPADQN